MMTWGLKYWPIFLSVTGVWILAAFGIPETYALIQHPTLHLDNTLSQYLRTQLHVSIATANSAHTVVWWITFVVWIMLVVFITAHIWFDQFG